MVDGIVEHPDAVALAADERGGGAAHARGIRDGAIRPGREVEREAAEGTAVLRDMLAAAAVARLAGDAELADVGVEAPGAGEEARAALRDVAVDARGVPVALAVDFLRAGRGEEGVLHERPFFLGDDVGEGKLAEGAALAGLEPVNLQGVRTGAEDDLPGRGVGGGCGALRLGADEVGFFLSLDAVVHAGVGEFKAVQLGGGCARRDDLRHGAVKRGVPARVVSRVTRAAGIRGDVVGSDGSLDGAVGGRGIPGIGF